MKQQLLRMSARINALTLRERVLLFAAGVATILMLVQFTVLGQLFRQQASLRAQISQQHKQLADIDSEIVSKLTVYAFDPDATARERLAAVMAETARLDETLRAMQKGLVAPERITGLLATILKSHGRLQLGSMKTLAVGSLADSIFSEPGGTPAPAKEAALLAKALTPVAGPAAPSAPSPKPAAAVKPGELVYRHGVELTVRGNYLDMIDYMGALEAMPTQLFWGKAELEVEQYPTARLTLTLYTLSLDPKWIKL